MQNRSAQLNQSVYTSAESQANKTAYLKSVYGTDASFMNSASGFYGRNQHSRSRHLFKKDFDASKHRLTLDDIDTLHDSVSRQLQANSEILRKHLSNSCAARNIADDLKSKVMDVSQQMTQAMTDFQRDVASDTLIRTDIDLQGKLCLREDEVRLARDDPQSSILIEANNKYYGQKLVTMLKGTAADLKNGKLPNHFVNKRQVVIIITEMLNQVLQNLINEYLRINEKPLGDLVDPKSASDTVLNEMVADDHRCKAAIMLIDMIKQEIEVMDRTIPELYSAIIKQANEFMMQARPTLTENCKGASGKINSPGMTTTFRESMLVGNGMINRPFVERMMEGIQSAESSDRVISQYGVDLTNHDLVSLKSGKMPTHSMQKWLMGYFRDLSEQQQSIPGKKGVRLLSIVDLNDVMMGSSSVMSNINVGIWKDQTRGYKGRGKTVFNIFNRIIAPIRVSPGHIILMEIRNGSAVSNFNLRPSLVRSGYPEIVLYDCQQRESRFYHNSLYMVMKRYIYEELLENSGNPQAECYQDSLMYTFRRGNCHQVIPGTFSGKDDQNEALICFFKNLQISVQGGDISTAVINSKDIDTMRLELFNTIVSRMN